MEVRRNAKNAHSFQAGKSGGKVKANSEYERVVSGLSNSISQWLSNKILKVPRRERGSVVVYREDLVKICAFQIQHNRLNFKEIGEVLSEI